MSVSIGTYAAAFLITVGLSGLIQWLAGPERAPRYVGLAFSLAFLFMWTVVFADNWAPVDARSLVGHIVLGAAILGAALAYFRPSRAIAFPFVLVALLLAAWGAGTGHLWKVPPAHGLLRFAVLALVGAGLAWRVERIATTDVPVGVPGPTTLVILLMTSLALAAVASTSGQTPLVVSGLLLAAAVAGYIPLALVTKAPLSAAMLCPAVAGIFGVAWGIVAGNAAAVPGVALVGLILFADGTARRVPLPKAGVSAILYPLIVAGVSVLPLALAVAVTVALYHAG